MTKQIAQSQKNENKGSHNPSEFHQLEIRKYTDVKSCVLLQNPRNSMFETRFVSANFVHDH